MIQKKYFVDDYLFLSISLISIYKTTLQNINLKWFSPNIIKEWYSFYIIRRLAYFYKMENIFKIINLLNQNHPKAQKDYITLHLLMHHNQSILLTANQIAPNIPTTKNKKTKSYQYLFLILYLYLHNQPSKSLIYIYI